MHSIAFNLKIIFTNYTTRSLFSIFIISTIMKNVLSFILLLFPLFTLAQTIDLGVSKDLGWAEWMYETIEFRDDCTILKGYFVPSGDGCWVFSKMDETLRTEDKEYQIIYTTLPINRHPRTTYKGGSKVRFEERFEPIFSTGGVVELTSRDISFAIPFKNRKKTKPYEELFPAYEEHIDTLISKGKYGKAAYLLDQYVWNVWLMCKPKAQKRLTQRILSKYRVLDFFLNASSRDRMYLISKFENAYKWLRFKGDDEVLKKLLQIGILQDNIYLNINGENPSWIMEMCDSLLSMVRNYGKYTKNYEYTLSLYRKALFMNLQMQKIPELDKEIIDVLCHLYDTSDRQYLEKLMNIASDCDIRPTKTSYETYRSINIWKEVRDKAQQYFPESWIYAHALKNIADFNYYHRHIDVALMQYLSIDSLYKVKRKEWKNEVWYNHDYLLEQCATLVDFMHSSVSQAIGHCYYQKGDIANSIKYEDKNPYYYCELGDYDKLTSLCEESYVESIKGLKEIIKNPTIISPGAYYEEVFDMIYTPTLTTQIPYFAYKTNSVDLYEKAYNGALITKEFRLTIGNRLRQYLRTTQDTISIGYHTKIDGEMATYHSMMKVQDLKSTEKHWKIVNLQREFVAYLDSIHALDTFFPNWKDVRNALKKDELAIEFIKFPLWDKDQTIYAALTLRRDSEHPKMTTLFEESLLKAVSDTLYYQCEELTHLVWTPLLSEFEGIKKIYFSPTGVLFNIGIEYLPGMENHYIYRLSSTRELMTKKDSISTTRAVLYGGLDYYTKIETKAEGAHSTTRHADVRGMGLRGGKEYLKHTKIEVEKIGEEFRKAQWVCQFDTASIGTEESFKSLSGEKIGCLHIATHGFYYTPEEAENAGLNLNHLNNYIASTEDKALTRSGLIMAGANHILEGEQLPDDAEDGILTAREIANVDLNGLDLVVLSACQTGLGDLSQGEGVFGLQRGFKKAGVNSILMSLWEIDDNATQILMTQFYKNWLAGRSKHQSLILAQKYLRETEDGRYNEPKYWAAFILLDGN